MSIQRNSDAQRRNSSSTRSQRRSCAVRHRAAVALCQPVRGGAGRADRHSAGRLHRADEIPRTSGRHRPAQRADGPAAGRRRSRGLSGAVALRAAGLVRPAVHAGRDDHRADRAGHADHRRADAPDHRGSLDRIPRRTHRDEFRPARPRHRADLGRALQPASPRCSQASAARRRRSAPSSSSAAISKASPAR